MWKSYDYKLEYIQRQREYYERELVDPQKRKLNDYDFVLNPLIQALQCVHELVLKELDIECVHELVLKELDIEYRQIEMERDIEYRQIKMERDIEYRQIKMELKDKNGSRKILRNQAHYVKFFFITVKSLYNDNPWGKKKVVYRWSLFGGSKK